MSQLVKLRVSGSPKRAGEAYGEALAPNIMGFLAQEAPPSRLGTSLAKRALPHMERWAPASTDFLQGVARATGIPLLDLVRLTLHEELVHTKHCTALAAGRALTGKGALIGQNWDWSPALFPWPGILDLAVKGGPRVLAYHYPGLWTAAGLNEKGLALLWTGAGYYPAVPPKAGVPTYVVIAEILRKKSLDEALRYLRAVPRAGVFVFFLGDAKGRIAVCEAIPQKLVIEAGEEALCRANHFLLEEMVVASRQDLPSPKVYDTKPRLRAIQSTIARTPPTNLERIKKALSIPPVYRYGLESMTVDSICVDCASRRLLVRRGGPTPGKWQTHAF